MDQGNNGALTSRAGCLSGWSASIVVFRYVQGAEKVPGKVPGKVLRNYESIWSYTKNTFSATIMRLFAV